MAPCKPFDEEHSVTPHVKFKVQKSLRSEARRDKSTLHSSDPIKCYEGNGVQCQSEFAGLALG